MSHNDEIQRYKDLIYVYKPDVYRVLMSVFEDHHLADELSHVVMINAWKGFSKLRMPSRSKAWVMAITRNVIAQHMNDKAIYLTEFEKDFIYEVEDLDTLKSAEKDILDAIIIKEDIKTVFKALNSLDDKYRIVVKENLIGQVSLKDIADKYGLNPGSVRVLYSRGMKKLRETYKILEKGGRLNGK